MKTWFPAQPKLDPKGHDDQKSCWLTSGVRVGVRNARFSLEGRGKTGPCGVGVFFRFVCVLGRNGRNGMNMDMAIFGCIFMGERYKG